MAHFPSVNFADVETLYAVVGNLRGRRDIFAAMPAVNLVFQLRNGRLATSSAIRSHVSAKLLDAKGQLVATDSRSIIDVHWPEDVDSVEAVRMRHTMINGIADCDAPTTFVAPVEAMCCMYRKKTGTLQSATIAVSIVS